MPMKIIKGLNLTHFMIVSFLYKMKVSKELQLLDDIDRRNDLKTVKQKKYQKIVRPNAIAENLRQNAVMH